MSQETRVGLFLLAAISAIVGSVFFLGNVKLFQSSTRYFVDFTNVEALPPKAAVKIAGVEIGRVRRLKLVDGLARVTIDLDPDVPIYANAIARVGSTGIIGSKFIELSPGTPENPLLKDGDRIQGINGGSLNEMVSNLSKLFEQDEKHGNAIDNLKETIANIRNVSRALNTAMGEHARDMEAIVLNVRDLTESAKVFAAHLEEISTAHKEDVKVALAKFRSIGERLDEILAKIGRGEGAIGTLVNDEQTGKNVKEAVASIKDTAVSAKRVLGRFTQIHTYWNFRYRYDFEDEEGKTDVGLTFVPKPGKFYALGGTNLGERPSRENETKFEKKNKVVAVLGRDYGPFTGYAGAIRSKGGAGLNIRPFVWWPKLYRRFELNTEISDFSRDRTVEGVHLDRALWSAGAHFAVTRWLWLGVRSEDLLERSAFMAYTNIVFRDEDLAYFFGFASLSR